MRNEIPVYLYGETTPFTHIPFEAFSAIGKGDMLSVMNDNGVISAYVVIYKEAHKSETGEIIYAMQVEEW